LQSKGQQRFGIKDSRSRSYRIAVGPKVHPLLLLHKFRREEGKNAKETRREEQKVSEEMDPQIAQMLAACNAFNPRNPRNPRFPLFFAFPSRPSLLRGASKFFDPTCNLCV
jgi:hypothetical protein